MMRTGGCCGHSAITARTLAGNACLMILAARTVRGVIIGTANLAATILAAGILYTTLLGLSPYFWLLSRRPWAAPSSREPTYDGPATEAEIPAVRDGAARRGVPPVSGPRLIGEPLL